MRDHIDRAAEIIYVEVFGLPDYSPDAVDDHNRHSYRGDCECNASDRADARHAAQALDTAGLLAALEHDAEVRADERAKVLAGFEWEPDDCSMEFRTHGQNCQCFGPRTGPRVGRWVGPWEPTP